MSEPHLLPTRRRHRRIQLGAIVVVAAVLAAGCGVHHRDVTGAGSSSAPSATIPTGSTTHDLTVGGTQRSYRTYVPANLDRSRPAPLVVMLHGGFGNASQAEKAYGWDREAQAKGFIVAYPDGAKRAWNAGTCCGTPSKDHIDDVAFITKVVSTVKAQMRIDPRQVFVTGMSNGAMMAERLACQTDVFAAVASVAGAQMVPCADPAPLSVLFVHGLADTHVPMDGSPGNGRGKVPAHPPATDTLAAWRSVDSCASPVTTTKGPVATSTAACPSGRAVKLITIAGAGHQWPGSKPNHPLIAKLLGMDPPSKALDATATIWSFFAAHPRPA